MDESCARCKYFDEQLYHCRRYPPIMLDSDDFGLPIKVMPEDWCGEFKLKDNEEIDETD